MGDERQDGRAVGPRLAGMMFLQYFGIGAWIVPLPRFLAAPAGDGGLGFDPAEVGLIFATWPIAGMTTPLLVAPLADRYFAAEKLLGVLQLLMAAVLAAAGAWCGRAVVSGGPVPTGPLFGIMLLYTFALLPTMPLTNVIAMRNLPNPTATFGRVRLVGTFGWIVAGLALAGLLNPVSPQPFYLAAGTALVQGVYAFTLPHTPPLGRGRPVRDLIGVSALAMFRDRAFVAFAAAAVLGNMMNQFYVLFSARFAAASGVPRPEGVLTLAQWCEMGAMLAVPVLVRRLGLRAVLLAGLVGWLVRNLVLAYGPVELLVGLALPLQGVSYVLFSIVGVLFVDREAPPHLRASAQALVTFLSNGPAVLLGNWLAGRVGGFYTTPAGVDWTGVWLVPVVGVGVAAAAFAVLFREPPGKAHG